MWFMYFELFFMKFTRYTQNEEKKLSSRISMILNSVIASCCKFFFFLFVDKVLKLIGGESVINRAYPV